MIPPVEERAVRPCYSYELHTQSRSCVFYACDDCGAYCTIVKHNQQKRDPYKLKRHLKCKFHFYPEEIKELIDSGVIG